jgi:hypothetical protein
VRTARLLVAGVLLSGLAAAPAAADRARAEGLAATGAAALSARDWTIAELAFRDALDADATYLPARLGLADALILRGSVASGVVELRRFLAEADASPDAAPAAEVARARERLAKIEEAEKALAPIVDRHVEGLLRLAAASGKKDPGLAADALRRVLALRPDHEKAAADLAALARPLEGPFRSLLNPRDFGRWGAGSSAKWAMLDGEVVEATSQAASGMGVVKTIASYGGDFDVRVEARMAERLGKGFWFGLVLLYREANRMSLYGFWQRGVDWTDKLSPDKSETRFERPVAEIEPPFDPAAWNIFEVRFRSDRIHLLVNDRMVGDIDRPSDRSPAPVGLALQEAKAQFRNFGVRRR